MITINDITMGFTQRTLFKNVTLSIFPDEKIGLAGPNGAGKTTLFSIIRGETEPLAGNVQIQKNINIGYLPQEAQFHSDKTVMEEMTEGDERIRSLVAEKRRLEDLHKADTIRYGDILEELEQLGIYELEHRSEKILAGLGFKEEEFHKSVSQLSGGWQMRVLLAKLLVYPFDLLLLDEPTNYLDLDATLWLKDFLINYDGAFVIISHDRVFLDDITNFTIILEDAQMTKVKGNFSAYEKQREIDLKTLEKKQKVVEKKRKQLERFTQRFHAQPNRAAAVRNKRKMIERLDEIELPQEKRSIGDFEFNDIDTSGYVVTRMEGISKSYGDKSVYKNLNLEITRGQKICLVGPNGAGKSTLLKMLANDIKPDSGKIKHGHNVDFGYFSQKRLDVLNPAKTAFDEVVSAGGQGTPSGKVRTLLGLFNFHGDDVFKPVKVLSGGEKSRVILAKLLINPPNFMLLDEPTTHLDLDGVKALTNAFREFAGTICFISHDLYFIREIASHIIEVKDGALKKYPGGLDYYLEKKQQNDLVLDKREKQIKAEERRLKKQKNTHNKKESPAISKIHEQHQKAVKRIKQIKKEVITLEQESKELETESYVKSRQLFDSFGRDQETLKQIGQRLKWIQSRQREIASQVKKLKEERDNINKV